MILTFLTLYILPLLQSGMAIRRSFKILKFICFVILAFGIIMKLILKKTRFNIIPNLIMITSSGLLWLLYFLSEPLITGIIGISIGLLTILMKKEYKLLKYYMPMSAIPIVLTIPELSEAHPALMVFFLGVWCVFYCFAFIHVFFQGRLFWKEKEKILFEIYSFILISEGTISMVWYFWKTWLIANGYL